MRYILITLVIATSILSYQNTQAEAPSEIKHYEHVDNVEVLALAIQKKEGYFPGSLAYRNNNPGNLRYSSIQDGRRDGFAYFDTYEKGLQALKNQIIAAAMGDSKYYNPEMTLLDFFNKYAPSSDNNNPENYFNFVIQETGLAPDMKIKDLL